MEEEVKLMESNCAKMNSILSSIETPSMSPEEHLKNRQVSIAKLGLVQSRLRLASCVQDLYLFFIHVCHCVWVCAFLFAGDLGQHPFNEEDNRWDSEVQIQDGASCWSKRYPDRLPQGPTARTAHRRPGTADTRAERRPAGMPSTTLPPAGWQDTFTHSWSLKWAITPLSTVIHFESLTS